MNDIGDDYGGPPIDEAQAQALLAKQQAFLESGLRASVQGLRMLSSEGLLWAGALENAGAVGILIRESDLIREASALASDQSFIEAPLSPYGPEPRELRVDDYLYHEFAWDAVRGTCCLIDSRRVLTAHHCIDRDKNDAPIVDDLFVVFDFQTAFDGFPNRVFFRASSVFRVVSEGPKGTGATPLEDWITLNLEGPAAGAQRSAATIEPHASSLANGVYTLGHPKGLCMRFSFSPTAPPCQEDPGCHYAFVDGYNGASGSPVFDAVTHRLVGILAWQNGSSEGVFYTAAGNYLSTISSSGDLASATLFIDSSSFAKKALAP